MYQIDEIAADLYRISIYVPDFDLQFNHFLVKDEEPLLYHTGMRMMFPLVSEAVGKLLAPSTIRWIGFSHFEVDECGALNNWLELAPEATPVCSFVGAMVNLTDFSNNPPRGLQPDEVLETGRYRFRLKPTPHLPHGWDASVLFEETQRTLLCSDLLHQNGQRDAITEGDIVEASREAMLTMQAGPLMDYLPYTPYCGRLLEELAALKPQMLATMHGSSFRGDGARALLDYGVAMREVMDHG